MLLELTKLVIKAKWALGDFVKSTKLSQFLWGGQWWGCSCLQIRMMLFYQAAISYLLPYLT
jgi:hypothetical protein